MKVPVPLAARALLSIAVLWPLAAWAVCPSITVSPSSIPNGVNGVAYGPVTFTQSGGTAPITWSSVSMPPGMALSNGGVLNGTPTQSGSFAFTATATDTNGCSG
jgi:hypothetical protein